MEKITIDAFGVLSRVRKEKPVVHHLTNWVTIYDCAQVVKTLGASPVMAHAPQEVADMARIAASLVLNIGTLTVEFVEAMKTAAISANAKGIPVVLDVCGAGATKLRDTKCFEILDSAHIDIIKGNASEIARIAGENVQTKGVDSVAVEKNLIELAGSLSRARKATVVITGKEDIVCDGEKTYCIRNGHELMAHIVGTGCMAASVIGAFAAVEKNYAKAAVSGLVCYEIAAQVAARKAKGPAIFKERMFDALYGLDKKTIEQLQKVNICAR